MKKVKKEQKRTKNNNELKQSNNDIVYNYTVNNLRVVHI